MKAVIQPLAWGVAMASMLALASGVALDLVVDSAQAAAPHNHDHDRHLAAAPSINDQKWPTDAALRKGMTQLRDAAEGVLPDGSARPIDAQAAKQLQTAVEDNVSFLIANCELSEQADAALHGLLADLLKGAKALAETAEKEQGAQLVLATLQRYPDVFAAPHWSESATADH
ncbi:DnrO protein [Pseudomonas stutzeri]|uniref:DnrO protein n=1 Tax=Stutzerimonas stutzeri TaxID=316 RepID=UPI00210CBDA1|nr:DnrO protein [Stutzerimonas stutzeri]MCQ4285865.1 DnrO protein [Stutzerimonas stutzeri]